MITSSRSKLSRAVIGASLSLISLLASCEAPSATEPSGPPPQTPPPTPTPGAKGIMVLDVEGLEPGLPADISVSGPDGFAKAISDQAQLTGLPAGRYRVTSREVDASEGTYNPAKPIQDVDVSSDGLPAMVKVTYVPPPGGVLVTVSGLPNGTPADISVTPPSGATVSVAATKLITPLKAGRWRLAASAVGSAGNTYRPNPASYDVQGSKGDTLRLPVNYALVTGSIAFVVSGLPAGVSGSVSVSGPRGFSRNMMGTATLTDLEPGTYVINALPIAVGDVDYNPTPSRLTVTVSASLIATPAVIAYEGTGGGRIAVSTSNLPAGITPTFTITGAGGSTTLTGAGTSGVLPAGTYTVATQAITQAGTTYTPTPSSASVTVTSGATTQHTVSYSSSGPLQTVVDVSVTGLPVAGTADITVTSPTGAVTTLNSSTVFNGAATGRWRLSARPVVVAAATYTPTPTSYDRTVLAGETLSLPVAYALSSGSIAISVGGLPSGANGSVTVTGPGGYSQAVIGTTTLVNLTPGSYTVTASNVTAAGVSYAPSPATRTLLVTASAVAAAAPITYTGQAGSLSISTTGLAAGVVPTFTLAGAGVTRALSSAETIDGLVPGSYTLTAATLTSGGVTYTPTPTSRAITISVGTTTTSSFSYTATGTAGSLALTVNGLSGSAANLQVTGPNGFSQTVTATTTLNGIVPGAYTVVARSVRTAQGTFGVTPASRVIDVPAGGNASSSITYAAEPALVRITVQGLPGAASAAITLTPPNGAAYGITGSTTVDPASAGRWRLTASNVESGGSTYSPSPSSYDQTTLAGDTLTFPVVYSVSTGSIAVSVGGLPNGASGNVTVTGPNSFSQSVSGTTTLTNLAPGAYTVTAASVVVGGATYTPSPTSRAVTVTASLVAAAAPIVYSTPQSGSLNLTVSGLSGASADVLVTGPNGFSQAVTSSTALNALVPGSYTIVARNVRTAQGTFAVSPASRVVDVTAGGSASSALTYAAMPAVVQVSVSGVPAGSSASMTLTHPSGAYQTITASTTVPGASGRWLLAASNVLSGGSTYAPSPASYDQTVLAGDTLNFPVTYSLASGSIAISVGGLPGGSSGSVTVTGPGSYAQSVTGTTTLTNLAPGAYTVTAASVVVGGVTYTPSPTSRAVTVTASLVAAAAPITYSAPQATVGSLSISATGLGGGVTPTFALSGTASRAISGVGTTDSLAPGSYTLTAATLTSGATTYTPSPSSMAITITAGATTNASVAYTASTSSGGTSTNLSIENVYVTQAVQNWAGTAKIVVNRDALVRVFVKAADANTLQPTVRVRVYDASTLLQTYTINAASAGVPTAVSEGSLSSSWNVQVPAAYVRANMQVLADVDPTNALGEANRTDNVWPSSGTPAAIATATAPTFTVKFVPVTVAGLTGNVTDANKDGYLTMAKRIWPLSAIVASVRAPFTSNAQALQSSDGNSAWLTVLAEVNALRSTDGAPATTNYFGVVKTSYGSGRAGLGYIPGRAAIGWDNSPVDYVFAHEIGHNFGFDHAPCGVSGSPYYPYSGGVTGAWGWNVATNSLVSPSATDIMGYCSNPWISDWTWNYAIANRAAAGLDVPAAATDGLLVWGRISNGHVLLEPAFRVHARPTPAPAKSTHRVVISDASGAPLVDLPIEAMAVDHDAGDERQFAVVVPWSADLEKSAARIAVRDPRSPFPAATLNSLNLAVAPSSDLPDPAEEVQSASGGMSRVSWNTSRYPMALVRDAKTGEILSFLRKSGDGYTDRGRDVELVFSDGVRSSVRKASSNR